MIMSCFITMVYDIILSIIISVMLSQMISSSMLHASSLDMPKKARTVLVKYSARGVHAAHQKKKYVDRCSILCSLTSVLIVSCFITMVYVIYNIRL